MLASPHKIADTMGIPESWPENQLLATNNSTVLSRITNEDVYTKMFEVMGCWYDPTIIEYPLQLYVGRQTENGKGSYGARHILLTHMSQIHQYYCLHSYVVPTNAYESLKRCLQEALRFINEPQKCALAWEAADSRFIYAVEMPYQIGLYKHVKLVLYPEGDNSFNIITLYPISEYAYQQIKNGSRRYQAIFPSLVESVQAIPASSPVVTTLIPENVPAASFPTAPENSAVAIDETLDQDSIEEDKNLLDIHAMFKTKLLTPGTLISYLLGFETDSRKWLMQVYQDQKLNQDLQQYINDKTIIKESLLDIAKRIAEQHKFLVELVKKPLPQRFVDNENIKNMYKKLFGEKPNIITQFYELETVIGSSMEFNKEIIYGLNRVTDYLRRSEMLPGPYTIFCEDIASSSEKTQKLRKEIEVIYEQNNTNIKIIICFWLKQVIAFLRAYNQKVILAKSSQELMQKYEAMGLLIPHFNNKWEHYRKLVEALTEKRVKGIPFPEEFEAAYRIFLIETNLEKRISKNTPSPP